MTQQRAHRTGQHDPDDWRTAAGILSGEDNYYRLLDVPMTASRREITRAYRMIMLKWHPDRVRPEQKEHAEDLAKRLNLAYNTLADPVKREQYDKSIRAQVLQSEMMGRYVGGFATAGPAAAANAPHRAMTEQERREQRQADRQANISVLAFFAAFALVVIVVLLVASLLDLAGSALF
jgi:DnaJ-class molecular chaperone